MELFIEILDEVLIVILEFQNLIVDEGEFVIFICKIKGLLGMFRLLDVRNDGESKKFNRVSNKEFIQVDRFLIEFFVIVVFIVSWYRNN